MGGSSQGDQTSTQDQGYPSDTRFFYNNITHNRLCTCLSYFELQRDFSQRDSNLQNQLQGTIQGIMKNVFFSAIKNY